MIFANGTLSRTLIETLLKVELHVHLDCCLSWRAVSSLEPGIGLESYRRRYVGLAQCANLAEFLSYIDNSLALLQTEEGLQIAVEDLFDQFRRDNVIYGEIRFAPLLHLRRGLTPVRVVSAVAEAVSRCVRKTGIESRVILCALRHFTSDQSMQTARLVDEFRGTCIAALDLAADEAGFSLANHIPAFTFARQRELPRTAHAGEARGPESVRETLSQLQPNRIGHGVRSLEDPALPAELRDRGIHLEVCPSCNIQIGLFESFADHPVDRLFQAGISVGINTDGRTLTNISLSDEYERLHQTFGWGIPEFYQCNHNALAAAFLGEKDCRRLQEKLETAYAPGLKHKEAL